MGAEILSLGPWCKRNTPLLQGGAIGALPIGPTKFFTMSIIMKPKNFPGRKRTRREKALELRQENIEFYKENIAAVQGDLEKENLDPADIALSKNELQYLEGKLAIAEKEKATLEKLV